MLSVSAVREFAWENDLFDSKNLSLRKLFTLFHFATRLQGTILSEVEQVLVSLVPLRLTGVGPSVTRAGLNGLRRRECAVACATPQGATQASCVCVCVAVSRTGAPRSRYVSDSQGKKREVQIKLFLQVQKFCLERPARSAAARATRENGGR